MTTTTAGPETPEQLREFMADTAKVKEAFKDQPSAVAFIEDYTKRVLVKDSEIQAQVKEAVQLGFAQYLKDSAPEGAKAGIPPIDLSEKGRPRIAGREVGGLRSSARRALYNKRARGAALEGIFEDGDEYFEAVYATRPKAQRTERSKDLIGKIDKLRSIQDSYGSEVPADGGFLIPETMRSQILQVAIEESVTRSRATVIPMSSLTVPIPMVDDTSHVSSLFGGVICYWGEEGTLLVESQAAFGRAKLEAKKLTGFAAVPNELMADAPAFGGFFDGTFPKAISWFEDIGFISGTGDTEPRGWLNCPATVTVAAEPGQLSKTIVWENILEMYSRLLPTSLGNAVWVANKDAFRQLMTMGLVVGTGGSAVLIGGIQQPGSSAPPMSILGVPLVLSEKVPSLGTTGDISLVDLSYYLIGDRQQMQTDNSEHYLFQNDKMAFRVIERVDGRAWLSSPITPHSGSSNTLSAFIQLASRP